MMHGQKTIKPTVGFILLSNFLPFRPFLTQLSPPSYSDYLYILFISLFRKLNRLREGSPVSITKVFATF
jgi:hypothetical protein